jgi:preprotein translocase subunit SecE
VFVRQVVAELRKVIWPTRHELTTYTTAALLFILVMVAIVTGLDTLLGKVVLAVFG